MRRFLNVVIVSALGAAAWLGLAPTTAEAVHLRVYLLGGQSNMDGRGSQSGLPNELRLPQDDVLIYARTGTPAIGGTLAALRPASSRTNGDGTLFGPEVLFGRTLATARPNENIALIKHAVGGTNLAVDWHPATGPIYQDFRATVTSGLAAMTAAGHTYELAGMLWMQGESDAGSLAQANTYEANLTALISDVRDQYGAELPFLIGQLSSGQTDLNTMRRNLVRQAQANVAQNVPHTALIVTDAMGLAADDLHFNAAGQIALGTAFGNAANNLIAVPEPATQSLLGVGGAIGTVGLLWRRRKF